MTERITSHPILGELEYSNSISFKFNGKDFKGLEGEPLAAALLVNGVRILRYHEASGNPKGIYCNIGHCYECRVCVDGRQGIRACLTPIQEGMIVESDVQPYSKSEGKESDDE